MKSSWDLVNANESITSQNTFFETIFKECISIILSTSHLYSINGISVYNVNVNDL